MKKYFFATLYIIFFTDIIAQRAVTGENNKVNFGSSMSILGSNFNNNSTLSSYKIQVFISKDILEKKKLNFSLGFGFSNRVLAKNILDPFDYNDVRSLSNFNYTLTHKYIELPLGLAYKFKNIKKRIEPEIGFVLSPVYLVGGKISYTEPEVRNIYGGILRSENNVQYNYNPNKLDQTNFSPIFNLNIGLSAGVSINQNFYVGLEGGYFVNDFGFPKNCGGDGGSCSRKIYYSTLGFTSKIIF